MEDLFKKVLYTGVGLVAVGAEKLQEVVDKLVSDNKISVDEGKKIVEDFFANTEARRAEFESKIKEATENFLGRMPMVSKADFDALVARVSSLESKVGATSEEAQTSTESKPAAKKTAAAAAK
ncbi:MAG: hypothetical protein H6581_30060 [Bacteroidia bacterium]|nr:hypothetical protein [Bacteroidia bacterium]